MVKLINWVDYVGPGWYNLVQPIADKAKELNVEIAQVKEKFGTLRIYTDTVNEELEELIREAEKLSEVTCESCGRPGKLRTTHGWLKTTCDAHT